ncbi:DUF3841 domain-containing protein [Psychrobacter pygoscelis]|uniref:DUF3841 domain-containing protein n=1 Tax=Psychrobacter pygoscelis TaxID=2488563 RepID=UPI00103B9FBA|nr:DUF3841 domain-containing protein [Psychrobacter pygoscelis]
MQWLKLWTVRPESDYFLLASQGVYHTDAHLVANHRLDAYYWMAEQLRKKVAAPKGVNLPVWAWYRAYGLKRIKPDLRKKGHLEHGERGVRIEFDVPDDLVLLSSFDSWYAVLNNHCLALSDSEYDYYKKLEQTCSKNSFEKIKRDSWLKIFDLNLLADPDSYEVQAVLWKLKSEWVRKVDFFIAR